VPGKSSFKQSTFWVIGGGLAWQHVRTGKNPEAKLSERYRPRARARGHDAATWSSLIEPHQRIDTDLTS
jgi:hypothetical protein